MPSQGHLVRAPIQAAEHLALTLGLPSSSPPIIRATSQVLDSYSRLSRWIRAEVTVNVHFILSKHNIDVGSIEYLLDQFHPSQELLFHLV